MKSAPCPGDCDGAIEVVRRFFDEYFGGHTEWRGRGCWIDGMTGRKDCEPIMVLKAAHHCTDKMKSLAFADILKRAGKMAKQQAIYVSGRNSFVILPVKSLQED